MKPTKHFKSVYKSFDISRTLLIEGDFNGNLNGSFSENQKYGLF